MNILIVTQYFWPEDFRINDIASALAGNGHKVTVLTGIPNYPEGSFFEGYGWFKNTSQDYNGITVWRVPLFPRGGGGPLRLFLNYSSFAVFSCVLAPFLCRGKFDLIFVYQPSPITVVLPALLLKKIKRAPLLLWIQDLWPESLSATGAVRSPFILAAVRRLVRFIYLGCDRVLVQSRAFVEPVKKMGVDERRIVYFPNAAETFYRPIVLSPDAPEKTVIPKGFTVMFAGNIGAAQDFAAILSAANLLKLQKDIHWVIIGDGRLRSWLEEQVHVLGLEGCVLLLARRPPQDMPAFFAAADVLLVTLRKDPIFALTIPAKVQSYLACAKPVAAALEGEGARVLLESGAGKACSPGDARALADIILAFYRMPETERAEMGERGRRYFEKNFERGALMARLESIMSIALDAALP